MKTTESYIRYSDHNQDDGYSIEYQISEIKEHCARHGLVLHRTHIDQAQTATKVAGREAFFQLIERVKDGTVGNIIVYKMNRMFRNSLESHKYRKLFRQLGVRIISVTEIIDEDSSSGRLMTNVLADIDQYQSETTSDHVKSSMREMARQGYYTGGPVTYGFTLEVVENGTKIRKKFVPCEIESKIVQEIFTLYAAGKSLSYIQDVLKDKNVRKKKGGVFTQQDIGRMLKNEMYIGTHRFKTQGYDELIIPNLFPAIVDKETWLKVQARKEKDKRTSPHPRKQDQRIYALTGFIFCSECGDYYTGYSSGASKRRPSDIARFYYACRKKLTIRECKSCNIPKDYIEQVVIDAIRQNILNDKAIKEISNQVVNLCKHLPSDIPTKLKKLKSQRTRLENKIDELIEMKLEGEISADALKRKNKEIEQDLLDINMRIIGLEEQKKNSITVESVSEYLHNMLAQIDNASGKILRTIFETFVHKVHINDKEVKVILKVYPYKLAAYNETNSPPFVSLSAKINR